MLKSKICVLVVGIILFLGVTPGWAMSPMMNPENPLIGLKAPEFILSDLNAKSSSFEELRSGKNAILFFWATWCPHCRTQIKEIQSSQEQFLSQNTEMILIDTGEQKQQIVSYLKAAGVNLNVYLDQDGQVSEQYKIFGLPTFVFVNPQGIVTAVEHHLPKNFTEYFKAK